MRSTKIYEIEFEGLKMGKHHFQFRITDKFFEELTYTIIKGAEVKVDFELDKKETMLIGRFEMDGFVKTECNRCMDEVKVPVRISDQIIYKFKGEDGDDEHLIVIPSADHHIDISLAIYELLTVSLPSRAVHKEGECNPDMEQAFQKYVNSSDEEDNERMDPRWEGLKKMN